MKHRIRWFGVLPDGERVPRNRHMNGGDWGWDVTCSCGWDSRTGGAIQERIREDIERHRWDVQHDDEEVATMICQECVWEHPVWESHNMLKDVPVYVRDIQVGDVVTDSYYAPPTTITVTGIRGGSTFTLYGFDADGTQHTLYALLPTNTLMKGRP